MCSGHTCSLSADAPYNWHNQHDIVVTVLMECFVSAPVLALERCANIAGAMEEVLVVYRGEPEEYASL